LAVGDVDSTNDKDRDAQFLLQSPNNTTFIYGTISSVIVIAIVMVCYQDEEEWKTKNEA
jgi:hypothetical protein